MALASAFTLRKNGVENLSSTLMSQFRNSPLSVLIVAESPMPIRPCPQQRSLRNSKHSSHHILNSPPSQSIFCESLNRSPKPCLVFLVQGWRWVV